VPQAARRPSLARLALLGGVLALLVAGCLPASIRATPPPTPTPAPTATPPPTPTPTPGPPTPTPAPTFASYKVRSGDTLTSIAKRFHTSPRSISYWNRDRYPTLDPESPRYAPDNLKAGWVLQVMPGQEYSPPPGDGETGIDVTPSPSDDTGTGGSGPPSDQPAGSASPGG
jgi:hypothetical protein